MSLFSCFRYDFVPKVAVFYCVSGMRFRMVTIHQVAVLLVSSTTSNSRSLLFLSICGTISYPSMSFDPRLFLAGLRSRGRYFSLSMTATLSSYHCRSIRWYLTHCRFRNVVALCLHCSCTILALFENFWNDIVPERASQRQKLVRNRTGSG